MSPENIELDDGPEVPTAAPDTTAAGVTNDLMEQPVSVRALTLKSLSKSDTFYGGV
jgi:hypothetical protein